MTYFCYKSGLPCGKWNLNVNTSWLLTNISLSSQITNYVVTLLRKLTVPNISALNLIITSERTHKQCKSFCKEILLIAQKHVKSNCFKTLLRPVLEYASTVHVVTFYIV